MIMLELRAENIKGDETKNMPFPCFVSFFYY